MNFPPTSGTHWCAECIEKLPWVLPPLCPCCGRPFLKSPSSPDHLCGDCELSRYPFDTARSATLHEGVVRDGIHRLKFGGRLHWIPPLVDLLEKTAREETQRRVDLIIPVPLHRRRLGQRGFNQAGLLATALGKRLGLPVRHDLLARKQWTEPQTRLNREERLINVKDAFEALKLGELKGKRVLLIDDVFTTGTTLSECTRILKGAKAVEVHALTVSRALSDHKVGTPPGD